MTSTTTETWEHPSWKAEGPPDPHLVTRAELLTIVKRLGLDADERDLRYWESLGLLPRPVRRRHGGATRALYPRWVAQLVFQLRYFQDQGLTLAELPDRMRAVSRRLSVDMVTLHPEFPRPDLIFEPEWLTEPVVLSDAPARLRAAATELAATYAEQTGAVIVIAALVLIDQHGRRIPIPIDIDLPTPTTAATDSPGTPSAVS